jgi:hypothetical protein
MQPDVISKGSKDQFQTIPEDAYPPQTTRGAEIDAFIELFRGVFPGREALYVSAPITSGRRLINWISRNPNVTDALDHYQHEHSREVVAPNRDAASGLVTKARATYSGPVIDPTVVSDIEGWTQGDYRTAWSRVIQEFVRTVVFADGWEFSNGCSYEFLIATKAGVQILDELWRPITTAAGISLLRGAISDISSRGLPGEFLRGILEDLESLDRTPPHSREAERALLGSILLDNKALSVALESITKEDFYSEAHRLTFDKMVELSDKNRAIDLVTLSEELAKDGVLEKAGGAGYLAALADGVPIGATAALGEYCRIVREKSTIRKAIQLPLSETSGAFEQGGETRNFKDAVLDSLSNHGNVAQFVSFSPNLDIRYSRIAGHPPNATFTSPREAIAHLLKAAPESSVNVRSYQPDNPKSREFIYGLRTVEGVDATVRRLAAQGLYTIVNETVDVNDGGVSGVALGDVIEFAPGDTPRCVEKPGTVTLPRAVALSMLQRVYGFAPTLPSGRWRIEFSIHPVPRGYRQGHTILWEAERESGTQRAPHVRWPNHFSRFLGDKAFGLLLADCLGFPVPSTLVISRNVRPFGFGRSPGTGETWLRTSPREPVPGKFATLHGWVDPFKLLSQEDPEGKELVSVLSQEGVRAAFSGASIGTSAAPALVEGVEGAGSEFMLGRKPAQLLPSTTTEAVRKVIESVVRLVGGTVKIEWVYDEQVVWILQMQQVEQPFVGAVIVAGTPARFRRFEVARGIDQFREAVAEAKAAGEGIIVVGAVGITSHFGDILRRSGVPSRIEPGT